MKVWIINGFSSVGKDSYIKKVSPKAGNFSSVDLLKVALKGLGEPKKPRSLLAKFKREVEGAFGVEFFDEYLLKKIKEVDGIVNECYVHIREQDNIDRFKGVLKGLGYDVETILIQRQGVKRHNAEKAEWFIESNYDVVVNLEGEKK